MAAVSNFITKKGVSLCIYCKENVRPTDMLQFYNKCISWAHYQYTELPTYTIVSLENSRRQFSCNHCVEIPDKFLKNMKQISSSKKSNDISSKTSLDTSSQLQSQLEINNKKIIIQNTLAQKEVCIDSLNKEKTVIKDALTRKEVHIETLQDRITELQDEKSLCWYKQNSHEKT